VAEIAKFSKEEVQSYEDSLKTYRDLKNSLDTAREEGKIRGEIKKAKSFVIAMLTNGEPFEKIAKYSGLSFEEIKRISEDHLR
jgi:predicted transposase/invertase (TIGR01784 family)